MVSKIPEKDIDNLLKTLSENECMVIIDYLDRYMQFIGESDANLSSGSMLKIYERILKSYGPSILIKSLSKADTLTNKIPNY